MSYVTAVNRPQKHKLIRVIEFNIKGVSLVETPFLLRKIVVEKYLNISKSQIQ